MSECIECPRGRTRVGMHALPAVAHPLDPAVLELREQRGAPLQVRFQEPLPALLQPILPARCTPLTTPTVTAPTRTTVQHWQVDCGAGPLAGERIGVEGLRVRHTDALLRVELLDGRLIQAVLRPDEPFITIPQRVGVAAVLRDYIRLGFAHIMTGPDHLLFVLGLVLLMRNRRRLLLTITAFALGHSLTLSLAVLGLVHVPPALVQVLIAASIVVVAFELTRAASAHAPRVAMPAGMALGFGFLHGLGFAGALAQIGVPAGEIPLALLAFNLGLEVGQVLFVVVVISGAALVRSLPVRWPTASRLVPAYTIGSLAAFWVLERLVAIL